MAEVFLKGSAYSIPFLLKSGKTTITNENVASVRLGLGNLTASWPGGRLRYSGGYWLFPVTQAQSYALPQGETYYQAQIQMASGETLSSPRTKIHIDSSIFRQPWGKRELDTGGSVDASAVTAAVSLHPEGIAAEIQNPGVVYGSGAVKYTPQTLTDEQKRQARENIGAAEVGSGGGGSYNIGHGLLLDQETNTISVNTVDGLENEDNTLPITAAAVSRTVGNINALLETI